MSRDYRTNTVSAAEHHAQANAHRDRDVTAADLAGEDFTASDGPIPQWIKDMWARNEQTIRSTR